MTSDWGNKVFIEAAKSVSPGIFVNCVDSESDRGDRIESLFSILFWAKEGAIDWSWLGLDSPGKERTADSLAVAMEWKCFKIAERALVDFFVDTAWPCAMSVLRVLQMCKANDLSVVCRCHRHVLGVGHNSSALHADLELPADHSRTAKSCTNNCAGILVGNEIKGQAFPDVRDLLSVKDKQAVKDFESDCAVVYISGKGHRQWPSVAESTVVFIAKCVGKAREEFVRQIADLRLKQKAARKEDEAALREAAREASRRAAKGEEPGEPVSLADIETARQKEDHLRYWTSPFKWGPSTRDGPPLERLVPLMSTIDVLTVSERLWPEGIAMGSWSDVGEPTRWDMRHVETAKQSST